MSDWKNTDPRYDINKRATIVIVRPSLSGAKESALGYVDTKELWHIFTDFEIDGVRNTRKVICVDDSWDPAWYWTIVPSSII